MLTLFSLESKFMNILSLLITPINNLYINIMYNISVIQKYLYYLLKNITLNFLYRV